MNSLLTEYNELSSNYNTLIDLIKHCDYNDVNDFLNLDRMEELKKQIPEKYFNKSKEQIKSEFKNVINELLKNNDNNVVFENYPKELNKINLKEKEYTIPYLLYKTNSTP